MLWVSELKRALQRVGQEVPRADRWPVSGLVAFYGLHTPALIKNISATGIDIGIQETLAAGQMVTLTLELEDAAALSAELAITIQARVARQEKLDTGLMFVLPPNLDATLWGDFIHVIANVSNREQAAQLMRTLHTVLFLCRLCPSGAEEAIQLLGGELDQSRTATLFKIAFAAEKQLAATPDADHIHANPKLVANLLRNGSWAQNEMITQMWAGLLVSSCSLEQPDDSNQVFADLLNQFTVHQAKILMHACERTSSSVPAQGEFSCAPVVLSAGELAKLTGIPNLARNASDLAHLFNLGLIRKLVDFTSYEDVDDFDITPSRLGFELYRRCHGERGKIEQFVAEA
jgi:hypothetical protein